MHTCRVKTAAPGGVQGLRAGRWWRGCVRRSRAAVARQCSSTSSPSGGLVAATRPPQEGPSDAVRRRAVVAAGPICRPSAAAARRAAGRPCHAEAAAAAGRDMDTKNARICTAQLWAMLSALVNRGRDTGELPSVAAAALSVPANAVRAATVEVRVSGVRALRNLAATLKGSTAGLGRLRRRRPTTPTRMRKRARQQPARTRWRRERPPSHRFTCTALLLAPTG